MRSVRRVTKGYHSLMAKLESERELACPCCHATLVVDLNLGRIVAHRDPASGLKIELTDAQRILAEEKQRREAAFDQSVHAERNRPDALSRRFEEALKQANEAPASRPMREFDLD